MDRVNPMFKSPLINYPLRNGGGASYFPPSNPKQKPKVVSIPVRFVGSETTSKKKIDPSIAAIKIQRIFRGFLVRKNSKIVRQIEADVDEIEKKFGADREMDLIVGDAKERLRINEMLMGLLFRLDSVRGVRDYRRRVIRRVILIQEMLDSIPAAESGVRKRLEDESKNGTLETSQNEKPDQEMADWNSAVGSNDRNRLKVDAVTSNVGSDDRNQLKVDVEIGEGGITVNDKPDQDAEIEEAETVENKPDQEMEDSISTIESADQNLELAASIEISHGLKPEVEDAEVKTIQRDDEALKPEDLKPESEDQISTGWELLETQGANDVSPANQESVIVEDEEDNKETVKKEESKNEKLLKEVMERVVAENDKLKGLVAELCQRSAQQCRLMGGLAERVGHLEKVVQKMEKKNKKRRKESASLPAFIVDKKC